MGIYTLFYGNVKYEFAMRYLGLKMDPVAYLLSKGNKGNDCISEMKFVFDGCFKIDLEMVLS